MSEKNGQAVATLEANVPPLAAALANGLGGGVAVRIDPRLTPHKPEGKKPVAKKPAAAKPAEAQPAAVQPNLCAPTRLCLPRMACSSALRWDRRADQEIGVIGVGADQNDG